jgi:hypothetical protein
MNRRDAALLLAKRYPGGIDALAARLHKRPDTLRKELTGVEGYKWGVDEEETLIELCLAAGVADPLAPLTAAAVNAGAVLVQLPGRASLDGTRSYQRLAKAAQEFGEFCASVADAESDGRVSDNEMKRADREGLELIAATQSCLADLRARNEAARPRLAAVGMDNTATG